MPVTDQERQLAQSLTDEQKIAVGTLMHGGLDASTALRKVASGGTATSAIRGFEQGATLGNADEAAGVGAALGARTQKEADAGDVASPLKRLGAVVASPLLGPLGPLLAFGKEGYDLTQMPEYAQGRDIKRGEIAASRAEHPYASAGGQVVGTLLPALAGKSSLPSFTAAGPGLGARMLAGGAAGAAGGGILGATTGVGEADSLSPDELALSVGQDALGGVATGGLLGLLSPLAGGAIGAIRRNLPSRAAAASLANNIGSKGIQKGIAKTIGQALEAEVATPPSPAAAVESQSPLESLAPLTKGQPTPVAPRPPWTPPDRGVAISAEDLAAIPDGPEANMEVLSRMRGATVEPPTGPETASIRTPTTPAVSPPRPTGLAVSAEPMAEADPLALREGLDAAQERANGAVDVPPSLRVKALTALEQRPDMPADVMASAGPPKIAQAPVGLVGSGGADKLASQVQSLRPAARVPELRKIAQKYGVDVAKKVAKIANVSLKANPL